MTRIDEAPSTIILEAKRQARAAQRQRLQARLESIAAAARNGPPDGGGLFQCQPLLFAVGAGGVLLSLLYYVEYSFIFIP